MRIFLLLGHPNSSSFNHAIASLCIKLLESSGHTLLFHDLYSEQFDPVHFLKTTKKKRSGLNSTHCSDIGSCDAFIVIHPNWWGQPPAIVKGWMDCILLPGVAYNLKLNAQGNYTPVGTLKATKALIITTSNTPDNFENDILDTIWKNNVFNICGVNNVERINFGAIGKSSKGKRELWLDEVRQKLNELFPAIN